MVSARNIVFTGIILSLFIFSKRAASDLSFSPEYPQIKINRIDASNPPSVKIFLSFLTGKLTPVKMKKILKLDVYMHPEKGKPKLIKSFQDGKPLKGEQGNMLPFSKSGEKLAAVFIFAGHSDPALRDGSLGQRQKKGSGILFKKLGDQDRANVLWYGDYLYYYVKTKGKLDELSKMEDMVKFCQEQRFEFLSKKNVKEKSKDEEASFPCGLFSKEKKLADILQKQPYEGLYPDLFGLNDLKCKEPSQGKLKTLKTITKEKEEGIGEDRNIDSAFEEAIRLLVMNSDPSDHRAIAVMSDGKDGYLFAEEDCKAAYREDCRKIYSDRNQADQCLKDKLSARILSIQKEFKEKLLRWLPMLRGAGIKVYSVGYPTSSPNELDRLNVLALKTGGTFRSTDDVNAVGDLFTAMIDEMTEQIVLDFDAKLDSETNYVFSVEVKTEGETFKSGTFEVFSGKIPSALRKFYTGKMGLLESKVGHTWAIVILAAAGIICILLLLIIGKLAIKLIKAVIKKLK
jgi:hypothetical protein